MARRWLWVVQGVLLTAVGALIARSLAGYWDQFRAMRFVITIRPGWIALSLLMLGAVSALQIESWRRILAGWAQALPFGAAARIWFLANLGRYIPGKVWSVAGMVLLAQRAGVETWAAAASTVAVQALGLGTAVAVVAAAIPTAASPLRLGAAALAAVGTIAVLTSDGVLQRATRYFGAASAWRTLPIGPVLAGSTLTLLSWLAYGMAFWLLAQGLGLGAGLPLPAAAGVFALGYIVGLLALFAPGGVGVREAVYIGLLTPYLGGAGAIALSLASRLQLTAVETAAGLGALLIGRRSKEDTREAP